MPASVAPPSASHGQHLLNDRVQRSMDGWTVIEKIVDFAHAVCRLSDGRGSAVLVALPSEQSAACSGLNDAPAGRPRERTGVLLTTNFVLSAADECRGAAVKFLEQPVAGTCARQGQRIDPVESPLRAEKFFSCSTPRVGPRGEEGEEVTQENLGYTLTLCDMSPLAVASSSGRNVSTHSSYGTSPPLSECAPSGDCVSSNDTGAAKSKSTAAMREAESLMNTIKPLPLPLLLSKIAPVRMGDSHLMVTHINGTERHYVVQTVKSVEKDSCEYDFFDPSCEFSSGGPIFNMQGHFVGIQHQGGERSYGIFISSIVRHLFDSMILGICRLPIAERSPDETTDEESDKALNDKFSIQVRAPLFRDGASDQLIEYEEFQRMRVRKAYFCSFVSPISSDVWEEYYTDFPSIVRILHAFSHAPRVVILALETLTSHEHRHHLPNVAALGGIGVVLEIIDGYPQNEENIVAALNVLARASLYPMNSEAIFRCDGVLTVLEIMNEYSHQPRIQQWGYYCLYNVMGADSPNRSAAIDLFSRKQGIALAIEALRVHRTERHVLRHTSLALSCVAQEDQRYVQRMLSGGLAPVLIEHLHSNVDDSFIFIGLVTLLEGLLRHVSPKQLSESKSLPLETLSISSHVSDDTTPRQCNTDFMLSFINTLLDGEILSVLTAVITREENDKYSTTTALLLQKCVESVLVLIAFCPTAKEKGCDVAVLAESCRIVMNNFTSEKELVAHAKEVVELLNIG